MRIKAIQNVFIRHNEPLRNRQSIWFLHGFGDSGLAYKEVFKSALSEEYNIYIVDLPGFGVSPINQKYSSIKSLSELLTQIINQETSHQQKINIVAHSLGALIGTWVCQNLNSRINYYFSIEGNLTTADAYFSSKPLDFNSAQEFVDSFDVEIFEHARNNRLYKRYYSSLKFADPEGMRNWSVSSQEHILDNKSGIEFKELPCKKIYIWGDIDTPAETQNFIRNHEIPNKLYKSIGHWHMIENYEQLYADINRYIKSA